MHAAALKDWEQQMAEHAERMAARKKAQKDATLATRRPMTASAV